MNELKINLQAFRLVDLFLIHSNQTFLRFQIYYVRTFNFIWFVPFNFLLNASRKVQPWMCIAQVILIIFRCKGKQQRYFCVIFLEVIFLESNISKYK